MRFVHLHNHSHYSLLDGLSKIDEIIEAALTDGAPAIGLTDHGTMYGAIEFYQKCRQAGIKPIIGIEAYLAPNSRFDKNTKSDEHNYYHLLLLAKNNEGYKNLIKLTSIAHLEGFYYKPRIDWEILKKYSQGLIASTACLGGEIPRLILSGKLAKAEKRILEYNDLFGTGNFYLEIMPHLNLEGQAQVNSQLIKFSQKLNIPLVATNDAHYLKKEDDEVQDVLLCLQNKKKKQDSDRMNMTGGNYSLRPGREMAEVFKDVPQAVANTLAIAAKCDIEIKLGNIQLPYFIVPAGFNENNYLEKISREGLIKRYGKKYEGIDNKIKERLDYELAVIKKMGWPSYFLIVADFVNWAKDNGIVVGPGRGSASGSLVCYLTGITNLDPLQYDLLFERFLNPDRISMPDIDLDFADTGRDKVIAYVENKYGEDHVAQIITFGTMAARAAVRDVGRVLDYPYDYCDRLAKMIPMFAKVEQALETVSELKDMYKNDEAARKILDYARKLEGVARHASTHACGVLITKDKLTEYVPLQYASSSDRSVVSQYSLHPIEELGLLKMDFLGLKNLTIIEQACKIIKNTRGLEINIDNIPLNDKKTFRLFQGGATTGVFQFESSGMKRYLRELKPTEFEDIIAMVALYRPGPMEWIPDYIMGKHGKKKPTYLHPILEPILAKTYGVALYQEQVMQMARDLAGFTMAEADVLRKAVGKKIPKLLAEQKEKFIDGCVKNSISSQLAGKIFSFIEPFAGYGFNRSHAACYAMIGYETAYLKAHWPTEFMAALLTSDQQNIDRISIEIEECRRMGIKVSRPDLNQSFSSFTVITSGTEKNELAGSEEIVDTIRFGLKAIKNVGENISEVIIKERKKNGPFKDISDLLERVTNKDLNKKSLESLIKSGSLDKFGERGQLLANMENLLNFSKEITKLRSNGQVSLFFDSPNINLPNKVKLDPAPKANRQESLAWEKELLGIYISEHPFSDYKKFLEDITLPLFNLAKQANDKNSICVAGIITSIKKIYTRRNEPMMFAKIEDTTGSLEVIVFPNLLKDSASIWQAGKVVICQGKLSDKDQEVKLLVNIAMELSLDNIEELIAGFKKKISNRFNYNNKNSYNYSNLSTSRKPIPDLKLMLAEGLDDSTLNRLKNILAKHSGTNKVFIKIRQGKIENILETGFRVNNNKSLIDEINKEFSHSIKVVDEL
ncbi:DNA polymerase III subunit alpha [Candidatus Falkowbacteria bacterium CG_4_10_14_0_2_um_filter_36_22]|nr:MAG: DNA polymerase III subunit alpha [Candidatus Falkowbacteria bacterium CG_4_8_14_3_um_filter_36_11]PJA10743.1 MAG: DNA polymerase III subunit alpha [Candidatus Falkowbacteria bacterium CG_4_10_14_0_2_um_filter_36_22]